MPRALVLVNQTVNFLWPSIVCWMAECFGLLLATTAASGDSGLVAIVLLSGSLENIDDIDDIENIDTNRNDNFQHRIQYRIQSKKVAGVTHFYSRMYTVY